MGEVYRAHDARLNREVAIKILPASFSANPERLQRFAQESRAAAALNHPNILSIFDIGDDHGTPYVVSELLEGETLRDRLRNGALSTRKAIDYAQQVAKGLAAAHEKGIIHRDLKPENLFVTHDGRIKILDFGLAKFTGLEVADSGDAPTLQVATEAGTVMGTAGYMSPEQVRGKSADAGSDIFSFGAVLYEMLSGKRAFHGDSAADTMSAILKEDPPDLTETNRNISPALERIVRHCLEKSPAERFQSARDVAFNLEALTDISAPSRSGMQALPLEEQKKSRRWLVPLVAGVLIVASWAAVYWYARRSAAHGTPVFHEITFRTGTIWEARFAPDGQTIVYGAAWDGQPTELFSTHADSTDSRPIGLNSAQIASISSKGEMAVLLNPITSGLSISGRLARVPLAGGAPREVFDDVWGADWTPDGQSLAVIRTGPPNNHRHVEFPAGNVIYEPEAWCSNLRFSSNGEWLAFADHVNNGDDGRVVITDVHGNHKAISSFYSSVQGVAWTPDGKEVWFSAVPGGAARAIYALDLSGKERLIYRAPGGLTLHDISRTGQVLLTADKARIGLYALPPGETHERSLSWFDWSLVSDMSPDGKTIVFSETGEATGGNYGIYLRKTDGSPAVRLADGNSGYLSPDGQWVLAEVGSPRKLMLLPAGVGESRQLTDDKTDHRAAAWLPDGKAIVYTTSEPGHGSRTFLLDLQGGSPRALTPEGTAGLWITPDGKFLLAKNSKAQWLYPIAGGEPQKLNFMADPNEAIMGFSPDGKSLRVHTRTLPVQVFNIDLATGHRTLWKEISPADPAGAQMMFGLTFTGDGKSYAYSMSRVLSDLFVVDGLK
jgi:Tol biopolymer transport system component